MEKNINYDRLKYAISQIAVRAEQQEKGLIMESFYDGGIMFHLMNDNHQIIRGRRGTGKTHILSILCKKMEDNQHHCIYIDCRKCGSAGEISDERLPYNHRAIQLIRDFLLNICSNLELYCKPMIQNGNEGVLKLENLLDQLYKECFKVGWVDDKVDKIRRKSSNDNTGTNNGFQLGEFPLYGILGHSSKKHKKNKKSEEIKTNGTPYGKIIYPNVEELFSEITKIIKKKLV